MVSDKNHKLTILDKSVGASCCGYDNIVFVNRTQSLSLLVATTDDDNVTNNNNNTTNKNRINNSSSNDDDDDDIVKFCPIMQFLLPVIYIIIFLISIICCL